MSDKKPDKPLNKPFRLPAGSSKKFGVYVKNDKGNVVKVTFGDPNMEIKRDDPDARKNFRARHNCSNPGPKWKARYWSCWQWRASSPVKGSEDPCCDDCAEQAKAKKKKPMTCWEGYERVPGKKPGEPGSCRPKKGKGQKFSFDAFLIVAQSNPFKGPQKPTDGGDSKKKKKKKPY